MHQRGEMNEFNDHSEIDMSGMDLSGSAAGKQSQQRSKAFPAAADRVDDVTFNCGIECRGLLRDARFDLLKVRLNQFCHFSQTMRGGAARLRNCAATRAPVRAGEEFHEARIVVRVAGCQSNITPKLLEYCMAFR
jgi:hypothetical protein